MKRVLLPTDFSDNSKNAIEYTLQFFEGQPCHFIFLNVQKPSEFIMDDFYSAPATASVNETILSDNKKALQLLVDECEQKYKKSDYTYSLIVDYDNLIDSINQVLKSEDIDLIVMGSNGATSANEVLFGSNTLKVIRKINCPVLVIPEGYSYSPLNTLLFSTHNQEYFTKGMQTLKDIINLKKPTISILDLEDVPNAYIAEANRIDLETFFEQKIKEYYTLEGIPIAIGIDTFTQLHPCELHALFVERKSFLSRFMFGSENAEINYRTRVPLLVLHA
ncbi:MAG: universal stress protein [Aureisphaera sp.]